MVEEIYKPCDKHPFGRIKKDSTAQPFRSERIAKECAEMIARMTGNECYVERRFSYYYIVRMASDERQVLA